MENKQTAALPMVGISSLLVIFGVLCLTVFALLSISTVRADERLGDSAQAAVTGYYAADCQAERVLASLRAGKIPRGVEGENGVFTYYCAISDTQALAVRVAVHGREYQVLQWQAVSTLDWQADDKIIVWDGEIGE